MTCGGGPIAPILILLLTAAMSTKNEIWYTLESYGFKKTLLLKDLDLNKLDFAKVFLDKEFARKIYADVKKTEQNMAFSIERIVRNLIQYAETLKKGVFHISIGATVEGTLQDGSKALIIFKAIKHDQSIENLRITKVKDAFSSACKWSKIDEDDDMCGDNHDESENSNDENDDNENDGKGNRFKKFALWGTAKDVTEIYNIGGLDMPLETSATIKVKEKNRNCINKSDRYPQFPGSKQIRFQMYNVPLRCCDNPKVNALDTKSTSCKNRNQDSSTLNLDTMKNDASIYFKWSIDNIEFMKSLDFVGNRIEVTSEITVNNEYDTANFDECIIQGMLDILIIIQEKAEGHNWGDHLKMTENSLYALKGKSNNILETMNNPAGFNSNTFDELSEAIKANRAMQSSFFNGRYVLCDQRRFAPALEIMTGRFVISPFTNGMKETLLASGKAGFDLMLKELQLTDNSIFVQNELDSHSGDIKSPLNLMTSYESNNSKKINEDYRVCPGCWKFFRFFDDEGFKIHPCIGNDNQGWIKIESRKHQNHLIEISKTLTDDQHSIAEIVLFDKKNLLLSCVGGSGKSYLFAFLILFIKTKYGPESILITSTTNESANLLNGLTIQKLLKLGIEDYDTVYKYINSRGDERLENVRQFVKQIPSKTRELLHVAQFFLMDEVKFYNLNHMFPSFFIIFL